LDHTRGK
jgi:hypothetical protein